MGWPNFGVDGQLNKLPTSSTTSVLFNVGIVKILQCDSLYVEYYCGYTEDLLASESFHHGCGSETTWRKNNAILIISKSADGNGDGDDRGIGGRDDVELQTTTAGRVAPGKGCVRVHPGGVQDRGGAEADTGRRQPVALAGPPVAGGQ